MTTLAVEKLSALMSSPDWPMAFKMLGDHWQENATHKHLMKLNPDLPRYVQLEREKRLQIVVMRDDGEIVGYSVHIINTMLHYRNVVVADDDIHYLVPRLRGTGEHKRLREFAMKTLKERGVHIVIARTREGHLHDTSLAAMGFATWDRNYCCDLTKWEPPVEG
jgi:L-amino acid N-acyltransferase YncA